MLDAWNQIGPECPKCHHVITADEPHYYSEDDYTEDTCPNCEAKFTVTLDRTVAWSTEIDDDADEPDPSGESGT